jgi:hypothetical protein
VGTAAPRLSGGPAVSGGYAAPNSALVERTERSRVCPERSRGDPFPVSNGRGSKGIDTGFSLQAIALTAIAAAK